MVSSWGDKSITPVEAEVANSASACEGDGQSLFVGVHDLAGGDRYHCLTGRSDIIANLGWLLRNTYYIAGLMLSKT